MHKVALYEFDMQISAFGVRSASDETSFCTVGNRAVRFCGALTGKMVQLCIISHDDCLQVFLNILPFREHFYALLILVMFVNVLHACVL